MRAKQWRFTAALQRDVRGRLADGDRWHDGLKEFYPMSASRSAGGVHDSVSVYNPQPAGCSAGSMPWLNPGLQAGCESDSPGLKAGFSRIGHRNICPPGVVYWGDPHTSQPPRGRADDHAWPPGSGPGDRNASRRPPGMGRGAGKAHPDRREGPERQRAPRPARQPPAARRSNHKAVVLAFVGAECPVSNLYLPGLIELEKKYRGKEVQFLAVYPNDAEDLDQVAAHAYDRDVPFPVLKDVGQKLADALGVTRVPDRRRPRRRVRRCATAAASMTVRRRRPPAEGDPRRPGRGARRGAGRQEGQRRRDRGRRLPARPRPTKPADEADVTLQPRTSPRSSRTRCQACHRPGQSAPFALMSYDDAVKHAPHDQGGDRRSGACRPGTPTRGTASSPTTAA